MESNLFSILFSSKVAKQVLYHQLFFLTVLGFEFKAPGMLGRISTTWAMPLTLFCFIYQIGSHVFAQGSWPWPSHSLDYQAQLAGWEGVLLTYCPGWFQTRILLTSASRVAPSSSSSLSCSHLALVCSIGNQVLCSKLPYGKAPVTNSWGRPPTTRSEELRPL
jgi:hypothetical protein